ncbi:hypothetical protein CYMTET_50749, partial [Cymbomonas tetramitiformis]
RHPEVQLQPIICLFHFLRKYTHFASKCKLRQMRDILWMSEEPLQPGAVVYCTLRKGGKYHEMTVCGPAYSTCKSLMQDLPDQKPGHTLLHRTFQQKNTGDPFLYRPTETLLTDRKQMKADELAKPPKQAARGDPLVSAIEILGSAAIDLLDRLPLAVVRERRPSAWKNWENKVREAKGLEDLARHGTWMLDNILPGAYVRRITEDDVKAKSKMLVSCDSIQKIDCVLQWLDNEGIDWKKIENIWNDESKQDPQLYTVTWSTFNSTASAAPASAPSAPGSNGAAVPATHAGTSQSR